MRIIAGANAWREIDGEMGDKRISRKRKGNVLVYYHGIHERTRDDDASIETTGEGPDLRKTIW